MQVTLVAVMVTHVPLKGAGSLGEVHQLEFLGTGEEEGHHR